MCGRITDLLIPPSFCDMRHCILLLVRYNLVFHLINITFVFSCLTFWSQGKVFQIWDKMCLQYVDNWCSWWGSVARSPLLHGYSMGRYGSPWAARAGDICPSLYSEYGCSVCTSSFVILVYSLSLYSDILQLCNLCLCPNNIKVYFVFLLFLSNRLDHFLVVLL